MSLESILPYLLSGVSGIVVGFLGGKYAAQGIATRLQFFESDNQKLQGQLAALDVQKNEFLQTVARLESELNSERKNIETTKLQMSEQFESISAKVAQDSQKSFLTLAEESFKRLQESAQEKVKTDMDKREASIKNMVDPMQKNLENLHKTVGEMEKQRHGSFSELIQNITLIRGDHEKLRATTSSLAQALRSPTTRGKWGEIHLQRALESVGMLEFVDFVQQDVQKTDDSFQKPDFVIHLPNQRSIVIDAKVPIDAFLDAMQDNISEGERKAALKRHAEQIRKHIKVLASKAYWEKLDSPEFVLMYLTSDSHYAAALESDPTLFEAGIENKVFLMTPSTLFPTLRVVEHAWKQEKLAQNAKEISTLGQELYKRLCVFGSHIDKMGRGLSTSLKAYDDAVGSLERTVMPAARKFRELQSMNDTDILTAAEPIARLPRQLNAPDFTLTQNEE